MGELAHLEVDDHEAAKDAVEEQEIDSIPGATNAQSALPPDEGEVSAELEQECFEPLDEGFLELAFGVLVLQAEELEHHRALDFLIGRTASSGLGC